MFDRDKWQEALAAAPPGDEKAAELFGALLVEWAYYRLRHRYRGRIRGDLRLQQELGDIVSQFVEEMARARFACLGRIPAERREGYLGIALTHLVARFFVRDGRRREREPFLIEILQDGPDESRELEQLGATAAGPEQLVIWKVFKEEVWAVLATMPQPRRDVFRCRHEQDMTARETAHWLQMPLGTVKWHDREARNTLRDHFADEDEYHPLAAFGDS